jgi:hypothetical protein
VCTLSSFRRRIAAQEHSGENIGDTDTHTIFVELKESSPARPSTPDNPLGPSTT